MNCCSHRTLLHWGVHLGHGCASSLSPLVVLTLALKLAPFPACSVLSRCGQARSDVACSDLRDNAEGTQGLEDPGYGGAQGGPSLKQSWRDPEVPIHEPPRVLTTGCMCLKSALETLPRRLRKGLPQCSATPGPILGIPTWHLPRAQLVAPLCMIESVAYEEQKTGAGSPARAFLL